MITTKQEEAFAKRYKQRYAPYKGEIPTLPIAKEQEEITAWEIFINALLGPKHKRKYKSITIGQKVFNTLWLDYGPIFK